jgi:two-component system sensor histidine kinase CreC
VKIRTAIFGVYVFASAIGLVLLMAFVLREVRVRYVESMRRTLNDTAALFAVLLESDLASRPEPADLGAAWRQNLTAFERAAGSLRVYVTDARGIVVFDGNGGRDVGRDYTVRPEIRNYLRSAYDAPYEANVVDGELRVIAPVRRNGATVGYVGVGRAINSVAAAVLHARLRLAFGALTVAAVMVVAGWWIARKLTHSLERLTAYAEAVRDGRPAMPPVSRAAEIAALVRAFDEMRVALEGKTYVERYTQAFAHEIKAPLSAIRGAAELLREDPPAEARSRFLANLRDESARIQQIVDRLLQLSAVEARHGRADLAELDLASVVRESVAAIDATATAREIAVRISAEAGVAVLAEKFLLVQAITNLLQNALEFSSRGDVVTVTVDKEGNLGRVTIDDAGPGVPDFARERIFERFYSLPRPDTGRKSTGLGLSLVREVALLHRGDVSVENRAPTGARARLRLPLAGLR